MKKFFFKKEGGIEKCVIKINLNLKIIIVQATQLEN